MLFCRLIQFRLNDVRTRICYVLAFVFFFFINCTIARAEKFPEYLVKAEMLLRFAMFIDWPEGTFNDPESHFVIAIAGDDPFGDYLNHLVPIEKIKNHPISLKKFDLANPPVPCHMLFICKNESDNVASILAAINNQPTLVVGDSASFAEKGAQIGFNLQMGRVRFHINLQAAIEKRLTIASSMLRLATKIHKKSD